MTDLPYHPAAAARSRPANDRSRRWLPLVCVFLGGAAGLAAGHAMSAETSFYDSKLALLLRFMAVIKGGGALLATGVVLWRMTKPITGRAIAIYGAALAAMAAAPGLIWSLGSGIAAGALLFHAGLLAFLCLAWADRGT